MTNIFFTSDTHFNHAKVITFEPSLRPFANIRDHDDELIKRWNARVRPKDIVWHLGDVYLGGKDDLDHFHWLMKELNGHKRLVRGNHDTFHIDHYMARFDEVYAIKEKYGFVMTHVPIHPESVGRWGLNVHGHLHSHRVYCDNYLADGRSLDERYFCVSVEQHNLAPISLDEIRKATSR